MSAFPTDEFYSPTVGSVDPYDDPVLFDHSSLMYPHQVVRDMNLADAGRPPVKRTYSGQVVLGAFFLGITLATVVGSVVISLSRVCS